MARRKLVSRAPPGAPRLVVDRRRDLVFLSCACLSVPRPVSAPGRRAAGAACEPAAVLVLLPPTRWLLSLCSALYHSLAGRAGNTAGLMPSASNAPAAAGYPSPRQ